MYCSYRLVLAPPGGHFILAQIIHPMCSMPVRSSFSSQLIKLHNSRNQSAYCVYKNPGSGAEHVWPPAPSTLTGHWEVKRTGGGENNKCITAISTHRRINRISLRIWTTNIWHCRCRAKQTAGIYISKVSEIPSRDLWKTENVGSVIHWEAGRLTNSL